MKNSGIHRGHWSPEEEVKIEKKSTFDEKYT